MDVVRMRLRMSSHLRILMIHTPHHGPDAGRAGARPGKWRGLFSPAASRPATWSERSLSAGHRPGILRHGVSEI